MEEGRLIEYVAERCPDLRGVHVRMIACPGSIDE
jgi:hypothetical protein